MTAGLFAPTPLDLPEPLRDPAPQTQREAIRHLVRQASWTSLNWPESVDSLMALGRADIPLSRLAEGHIDALRILTEAGVAPEPEAVYGVWASQSGGTRIRARVEAGQWWLQGELRFASGAGVLDRALVPVWPDDDMHVLLDAAVADWPFDVDDWRTRAMERSRSHRVTLDSPVAAHRIGDDNFYLERWGFFAGGVGVAAVWTGCAARLLDLLPSGATPESPSPATTTSEAAKALRLGRARAELATAVALVRQSGIALHARAEAPATVATLCRAGVGAAIRRLLDDVRSIAGPAGMAFDEDLTRAIDDLAMYVAQQSEDGDAARLGVAI